MEAVTGVIPSWLDSAIEAPIGNQTVSKRAADRKRLSNRVDIPWFFAYH